MLSCCFEAFSGKIHRELLFLVIKLTISEKSTEVLRKLFFLKFEKGNSQENLDLFKQLFLIKPEKGININKNCFSPQSEPHSPKLYFSGVLKLFRVKSQRTSLFIPKSEYLRKDPEYT